MTRGFDAEGAHKVVQNVPHRKIRSASQWRQRRRLQTDDAKGFRVSELHASKREGRRLAAVDIDHAKLTRERRRDQHLPVALREPRIAP